MWGSGPGYMMGGWGYGGFGGFGMIIGLAILIALIAAGVWFVRKASNDAPSGQPRRPPALDILEGRYARGEIERDDYLAKKRDLGG